MTAIDTTATWIRIASILATDIRVLVPTDALALMESLASVVSMAVVVLLDGVVIMILELLQVKVVDEDVVIDLCGLVLVLVLLMEGVESMMPGFESTIQIKKAKIISH